ncbi:hypothetical protein [Actinokineospora enzanensis]|uniref:hypothetical protein n=1 Tax=Actinokineospora enzanensis TaxID=155975 RepID=UPI00037F098B|nr:hypothetical protein [Actinokineospora enzanensis]
MISTRLDALTATVQGPHGIELTVNLDGKPIALHLGTAQRHMSATALARELITLTHRAAAQALADGLATLAPFIDDDLLTPSTEDTNSDDWHLGNS